MATFPANRQRSTVIGIAAGYFILLVCTVVPLSLVPDGKPGFHWALFVPLLFVLFFLYVLTASVFRLFLTYKISSDGLLIHKPPFHTRRIPFNEIKALTAVSDSETRRLMEASLADDERFGASADLAGYVRMLRRRAPAFKYFTIAPTVAMTTTGARDQSTSMHVTSRGGMIVVRLKNDEELYLTPRDPDLFMKCAREWI